MPKPSSPQAENEDAFVARYLEPLTDAHTGALGLKDDAACLALPDGESLVVSCDTLISGTHALFDASAQSAAAFAHKALAVNVSDLCAKGAKPMAYMMSLAIPPGDVEPWMPAFAASFHACQKKWGLYLLGGDTVRTTGQLTVTITAFGTVPHASMIQRNGANPGDAIYVTGAIGDAALGLRLATRDTATDEWAQHINPDQRMALMSANSQPEPRTPLVMPVRRFASAAIDISDGFVRDLQRLLTTSGLGADMSADTIPLSPAARALLNAQKVRMEDLLTGGDDYEIIACIPTDNETEFCKATADAGVRVTKIAHVNEACRVNILNRDGKPLEFSTTGWDHFA